MVSSVTGPTVSNPGAAGYGAAKAAMDGLMRAIAIESGRFGVTANSVAPGWIATGSQLPDGGDGGDRTRRSVGAAPRLRWPRSIAFLAGERASYVTGRGRSSSTGGTRSRRRRSRGARGERAAPIRTASSSCSRRSVSPPYASASGSGSCRGCEERRSANARIEAGLSRPVTDVREVLAGPPADQAFRRVYR